MSKADGWIKGEVRRFCSPGEWIPIEGWIKGSFGIAYRLGQYDITHLPTGYGLLGYFKLLKEAKRFCDLLESRGNWTNVNRSNRRSQMRMLLAQDAVFIEMGLELPRLRPLV